MPHANAEEANALGMPCEPAGTDWPAIGNKVNAIG